MSLVKHTRRLSLVTLVSRITGMFRDILIAAWLNNNWVQDSFRYAFQVPNLFRNLLGEGALAAAFVPVLSEKLGAGDRAAAGRLFGIVATILALLLGLITLAVLLLIGGLWLFRDQDPARTLLLWLTALMFPYVIFVCLVALFSAALNCLERFSWPALMPVLLNVLQIAAVFLAPRMLQPWWPRPEQQIYFISASVLLAGILQLLLMLRAVKRAGIAWRWELNLAHPDLRRILVTMGPMMLGLGMLQFVTWFDSNLIIGLTGLDPTARLHLFGREIAYPLAEGTMSAVDQARRLYQFPLGILGISLATVAFPLFSRLAAQKDYAGMGRSINSAIKLAIFEALPSSVLLIVLSELMVRVLFQHGKYTAESAAQTAHILRFYSLGIWAYCVHHLVLRAYYSLHDTITPLKVMAGTLTLALLLDVSLVWVPSLGAAAFGLSTSIMASLNVIFLGRILARRVQGLQVRELVGSTLRTALASAPMGLAAWAASVYLPIHNRYLLLLACLLIAALVFGAAAWALKLPEAKELFGFFLSRRHKPTPPAPAPAEPAQLS